MTNRLYVGNLSYSISTEELAQLFGEAGTVTDAKVLTDRETGRSRGFGFVTMSSETEAAKALQSFNGYLLSGRTLVVNEAVDRQPRESGQRPYIPRNNIIPVQNIPESDSENNKNKSNKRRRRGRDEEDY